VMIGQKDHTDLYIASVLSYIRNSFGNKSELIKSGDVKNIRKLFEGRDSAWTLETLNKYPFPVKK